MRTNFVEFYFNFTHFIKFHQTLFFVLIKIRASRRMKHCRHNGRFLRKNKSKTQDESHATQTCESGTCCNQSCLKQVTCFVYEARKYYYFFRYIILRILVFTYVEIIAGFINEYKHQRNDAC